MISCVLLEIDHKSLSIYKLLDRDLKQTAFILSTQKFPLIRYIITGQRNTFSTLKSSIVVSLFQCKTVSTPFHVFANQCFERIPIYYQNELQFVHQVTRKTFPRCIKASCKADNFDQQITLDADGDESCRLTPYPFNAKNHVKLFTLGKIERRNT